MKKILYLMGVDWYWIKQRPQILALELEKDYNLTVVYLSEVFQKTELRNNKDEVKDSRAMPAIPLRDKSGIASWIQNKLFQKAVRNIHEYDMIWLAYPTFYKYIDRAYKGKIIYDCMDDHCALCGDERIGREVNKVETQLIQHADIIFASSTFLKKKIEKKGGEGKTFLIRNGFQQDKIYAPQENQKKEKYKIGYFGTIAKWMDFDLINDSLKNNPDIEYHFIGPSESQKSNEHERIIFEGVVEHELLYEKTKDYDAYIMPFQVNNIIQAVDPVKLYEYISMGKCVISVWYEEIDRFSPYVYFYKSKQEFMLLLGQLCQNGFRPKYNEIQQKQFLKENSWENRCVMIRNHLKEIFKWEKGE